MTTVPAIAFGFADGVLHIRQPGLEYKIRCRPDPYAEEKDYRGKWRECWPEFRLLKPQEDPYRRPFALDVAPSTDNADLPAQKRDAFDAFRKEVNPEHVALVERFGSHQWSMIQLMHKVKAGVDLARANPVLAYCLANNSEFRESIDEAAHDLAVNHSHHKQRAIVEWLGFPGSEAVVRLFKRIIPEAAYPALIRRLRNALELDGNLLATLAHHDKINAGVLELVTDHHLAPYVAPKLLVEVANEPDELNEGSIAANLMHAIGIMRAAYPERPIRLFTRIAQVREFVEAVDAAYIAYQTRLEEERQAHQEAVIQAQRAARRANPRRRNGCAPGMPRSVIFPVPPIPGTDAIVPIDTNDELKKEGQLQHNCVGSYCNSVMSGVLYIYRVLRPERATLSIIRGAGGAWRLSELKKDRNYSVHPATVNTVKQWLEAHRISL
jgi:hypothetical protein